MMLVDLIYHNAWMAGKPMEKHPYSPWMPQYVINRCLPSDLYPWWQSWWGPRPYWLDGASPRHADY